MTDTYTSPEKSTREWLTVADAAEQLHTTIPRLRRLLAKPGMAQCSHQEDIETKRGTRTSTVVFVSELGKLKMALSVGNTPTGVQEQKQAQLRTFSETEMLALQTTLRRTEELLQSKDNELAAKDEIIFLLRDKVEGLKRIPLAAPPAPETPPNSGFGEREQEQTVLVSETREPLNQDAEKQKMLEAKPAWWQWWHRHEAN